MNTASPIRIRICNPACYPPQPFLLYSPTLLNILPNPACYPPQPCLLSSPTLLAILPNPACYPPQPCLLLFIEFCLLTHKNNARPIPPRNFRVSTKSAAFEVEIAASLYSLFLYQISLQVLERINVYLYDRPN